MNEMYLIVYLILMEFYDVPFDNFSLVDINAYYKYRIQIEQGRLSKWISCFFIF